MHRNKATSNCSKVAADKLLNGNCTSVTVSFGGRMEVIKDNFRAAVDLTTTDQHTNNMPIIQYGCWPSFDRQNRCSIVLCVRTASFGNSSQNIVCNQSTRPCGVYTCQAADLHLTLFTPVFRGTSGMEISTWIIWEIYASGESGDPRDWNHKLIKQVICHLVGQ